MAVQLAGPAQRFKSQTAGRLLAPTEALEAVDAANRPDGRLGPGGAERGSDRARLRCARCQWETRQPHRAVGIRALGVGLLSGWLVPLCGTGRKPDLPQPVRAPRLMRPAVGRGT